MIKSLKLSILLAIVAPLLMTGCDDLFSKGDTEKSYSGPDQVAFRTLDNEIAEGDSQTLEIQFISSKGKASSDVTVNLSATSSSNFSSYSLSSSSVTISAGETSATVTVSTTDDSNLGSGDEGSVTLTIDGAQGAEVAPNLSSSIIYVAGT